MASGGGKDGGPEEGEEQELSKPPEDVRRRSGRTRFLSLRLRGFDLGDCLGVGGGRRYRAPPRQGGRPLAGDFFTQPSPQGVVEAEATPRRHQVHMETEAAGDATSRTGRSGSSNKAGHPSKHASEDEVDQLLADLRAEAEDFSPGVPGPPPHPAFPALQSSPSPESVQTSSIPLPHFTPAPILAPIHTFSPSPTPSPATPHLNPTPEEAENARHNRREEFHTARRRLLLNKDRQTSRGKESRDESGQDHPSLSDIEDENSGAEEETDDDDLQGGRLLKMARQDRGGRAGQGYDQGEDKEWPPTLLPADLLLPSEDEDPGQGCLDCRAGRFHQCREDQEDQRGVSLVQEDIWDRAIREAGARGLEAQAEDEEARLQQTPSQGHVPMAISQEATQEATQQPPLPEDLPTMELLHRTHIPTHKYPPKSARGDFAREITTLWDRMARNPEDTRLWQLEYMFARVILPAGGGPRKSDAFSQGKLVKERLRRWRLGEYCQLWEEAIQLTKSPTGTRRRRRTGEPEAVQKTQEEKNSERAGVLASEGQYTRALQALTSAGMADQTRATEEEMRAKHPAATPDHSSTFQPTTTAAPMTFSQKDVFKAIKSFKKGSAPGPSGLRPEHIKCVVKSPSPSRADKALEAITKLINVMAAGKVPEEVAPYISGARLHAANKKDGGIRPIAVGNLIRRLVSKLFSYGLMKKAVERLAPHQLGVGVRGGCEAILHAVRQVLEEEDPDKWVLQVDLKNAFNMVNREVAFREVQQHFPEAMSWVLTCYGVESELVFGDAIISSSVGFHQGDPLASLLFSLVLHLVVVLILQEVPTLDINAWFLDDGTLVGCREDLRKAVDIIQREGPDLGLNLSTAATVLPPARPKSSVWCPVALSCSEADPLQLGIPRVEEPGIILLGCPVGDLKWEKEAIEARVEKVRQVTGHLPLLKDPHTEFVLLRSCLALPKVMHLLRSVDPTHLQLQWTEFDRITREALTRILGAPITDLQWRQAKLPVSMGGMGMRAAVDHGPAAHTASLLASRSLVRELLCLPEEASQVTMPPPLLQLLTSRQGKEATLASLEEASQRTISLTIDLHNASLLSAHYLEEEQEREVARIKCLGLAHAGDWLNVVPSPSMGLHLRPLEFTMVMRYRLGMDIYAKEGQCPACGHHSDRLGDHAMCCGTGGERIARHDRLRDAIFHTAVSAALGPTKEERGLIPGGQRRPGDVFVPCWSGGRDTALDVTVVCPLQVALVAKAAATSGAALSHAHEEKIRKCGEECRRQGIVFLPLAAESLGGWHPVAVAQLGKLGAALARQTGQEEGEVKGQLFQRLSLLLQKGNAALFSNRMPEL